MAKMEDTFINDDNDSHEKEEIGNSPSKGREVCRENCLNCSEVDSQRSLSKPERSLILDFKRLKIGQSGVKGPFVRGTLLFDNKIPKHVVTLDEKYLRHCLELIHVSASKSAQCSIPVNLGSMNMDVSSDGLSITKVRNESTCDLDRFVLECPLVGGAGNVVISSTGQWLIGPIMDSKSMMHKLNSSLVKELGELDIGSNFGTSGLNDVKDSRSCDFMSSSSGLSNYSLQKLEKKIPSPRNHKHESGTQHRRLISMSSTNSTCSSDHSGSSTSTSLYQGMLQSTWKNGIPHFVFSLDDQREVYVASLYGIESADNLALDFAYLFHLRKGGGRDHETYANVSRLIGKMDVSTSFTLCPNNSKIMEREFTLFSSGESLVGGTQTASHNLRKNKGLSKKVVNAFRISQPSRQRSVSKFDGASSTLECSWEPYQDIAIDTSGGVNLLENHLPPNFESVAIVVEDHLPDNRQTEVGGWGLKFLRKANMKQTINTLEDSVPSACCTRDIGVCSTSLDVLVPAGLHGGPRTQNGGPSSLIERWKSGGSCDCGGWDLGCLLTILKTRSSKEEASSQIEIEEECKSFDLFIQGSKHSAPGLRIVNVHDDLYFIHFQSSLSALQAFSIAVAYIHSQNPTLWPKTVQELK